MASSYTVKLTDNITATLTTNMLGATVHLTGGYSGVGCAGWAMVLADRLYRISLVAEVQGSDGQARATVNGYGVGEAVRGCLDEIRLEG